MTTSTDENWKLPLLLSCLAGGSTCIGAAVVFIFSASQIQASMPFSLSLAASVMITVSVIAILPECLEGIFVISTEPKVSVVVADMDKLLQRIASFAAGCFSYWILSKWLAELEPDALLFGGKRDRLDEEKALFTSSEDDVDSLSQPSSNKRESIRRTNTTLRQSSHSSVDYDSFPTGVREDDSSSKDRRRSWRLAMLLFVSLLCHNFPEGLAVAASAVESKELGVEVAIGILIHNTPEGIAIAVPCIAARPDSPWLAFLLASGSGLAEPFGAVVALFALKYGKLPLENVLACVAGIMCMVSIVELYPEAVRSLSKNKSYFSIVAGTLVGMAIMMLTEWYLP